MYVFVYGTLQRNQSNHGYLKSPGTSFVTTAVVRGFELYNSGFPVANYNPETIITGEVFDIGDINETVSKKTLWNLDSLEGYREDAPDRSMYHRKTVLAYGTNDLEYECSIYIGNPVFWSDFSGMKRCSFDPTTNAYTWKREGW